MSRFSEMMRARAQAGEPTIITMGTPFVTVTGLNLDARKQKRARKPTLVSVAKQASKAGIPVARFEVTADGRVVVVTGKPEITNENNNPWDEVLKQ